MNEKSEQLELPLKEKSEFFTKVDFVAHFNAIADEVHATAKEKGWWDEDRNDGECLALMHSEISEALEGLRKPKSDEHLPMFDSVAVELADCIIRVMDFACAREIPVAEALIAKMDFNKSRPHKHGKKF